MAPSEGSTMQSLPEATGPCGLVANALYMRVLMPVAGRVDGGLSRVNGSLASVAGRVDGYLDTVERQLDPNFKYHEAARAMVVCGEDMVVERWKVWEDKRVGGKM
ncbi:hypothetical protein Pmar_PMAR014115 [Perkinsus marinus ATCC 50983]|uniref:Uncharacterized protein n=1 Tax=Perkinsus marinus (strain ATCC 50983 / TXsc) TaxID=423536 RepID=C5KSS2_PERM5|nr:hypothetical protein Pmar_PMAR014115 [Perkinsus marinus ATCC 50983]EER12470.1 hypothetical protein Pmar_PMAR014115 [Perkinsus marinus ATCC 50983]|eukprot:XP_002780675.1 hypothetical protein Pmar_PMAR014115 [Perkinsus marinus ATCC 50983]